ncbi:MAG: hypothetical protein ABEJ87_01990 [Candidatus Nanohalobium sp.]
MAASGSSRDLPDLFRSWLEDKSEEEQEKEETEPDLYDFTERSGHEVGELVKAYSVLEGSYYADEEEEKVVVTGSTWNQVEEILEKDEGGEEIEERGWKDKASSYLFENDSTYVKGGLGGMGTGLVSGALGYAAAADLLFTGGALSLGWGIGSALGKYVSSYLGSDDEEEEGSVDSEMEQYSDWDLEVVDIEAYGEALRDYRSD